MNNRKIRYGLFLFLPLFAAGCASQEKASHSYNPSTPNRVPAADSAPNFNQNAGICGYLYFAESNRYAVDDNSANYFMRVDCNHNGKLDATESKAVVNFVAFDTPQQKGALTRTRRTVAKKLDKTQSDLYKAITPSGWLAASKRPAAQLPYEKVKNYRSYVVYMCADTTVDYDPCNTQSQNPTGASGKLNQYVSELDATRFPRTKSCLQTSKTNCFPKSN